MITEEVKEKNYDLFLKKLEQIGVETATLDKVYGEKLMNASFTNSNENGQAYDGSFIEIMLKKLTSYAVRLNELLPEEVRVDKNSLVKVCLLHQIAKSIRLVKNDNLWEIEKRNLLYKYNNNLPAIRTGFHSLLMCTECGINFTLQEAEAMTVNDREMTDEQARWYSSVFSNIVRQASELTYMELNFKG